MDWPEVMQRIRSGEDGHTEFKRNAQSFDGIGRALCAFANGDGGLLVIGVDDDGEIVGTTEAPDRLQERLTSFLHNGCGKPVSAVCGLAEAGGRRVHWIHVPRHQRRYEPFSFDGRFWVRRGRSSVAPSASELQELFNAFGIVLTEKQVVPSATIGDIDVQAFRAFMESQGVDMRQEPQPPVERDLDNASVCAEFDGELRPTLYGVLVFGRTPQAYPHTHSLFVQCTAYAGSDRSADVITAADCRGTITDQVHRAVGWFRSLGHRESYQDGIVREDTPPIPDSVLREAIVNGVIHRDYAIVGSKVMVEVFDDRVDVTSPGTLPNHMTVDQARGGGAPRSRNELLANAMLVHRLMEARGRGWLSMRRSMREFNGSDPELVNATEGAGYVRASFRRGDT